MLKFWNKKTANSEEDVIQDSQNEQNSASLLKLIGYSILAVFLLFYILGIFWSSEPDPFDVRYDGAYLRTGQDKQLIVGHTTVMTTEKIAQKLLDKPGGFLSNDVLPPSVFLDNIPNWEFGVLVQVRDMVSALRNHISRSQSQSLESSLLKDAEPLFNNDHTQWILPAAENKYERGIKQLAAYREELGRVDNPGAQFYARADNLRAWLTLVEKRLGGLSQRLSASVGQERINTDLSGDPAAHQSTESVDNLMVKTPWLEIDDTFFEARGACWALIHLLKAIEVDFAPVLEKKNAKASLAQIIRELESTQDTVWSPVILNGDGFGFLANHSLVMASYISRANAGLIDLRELLSRG